MKIIKSDGRHQSFMPNKLLTRIKNQSKGLNIDSDKLFQEVISLISDGMNTTDIDELLAFKAADKVILHPDYSILGGRILLSRQSKIIGESLQDVDLTYDFFAATTFLEKYSTKNDQGNPDELPHNMYERVSKVLAGDDKKHRHTEVAVVGNLMHKRPGVRIEFLDVEEEDPERSQTSRKIE